MNRYGTRASAGSIMIRIAATLFCLVLISTSMMSGLYAKYTARGNGGDDGRVAVFAVGASLAGDDVEAELSQSDSDGSYVVTVTNSSEVAVKYDVLLTTTIPSGVEITLDGNAPIVNGSEYLFKNVGDLAPSGAASKDHQLVIDVGNIINTLTSSSSGNSYSQSFAFELTVKFTQID